MSISTMLIIIGLVVILSGVLLMDSISECKTMKELEYKYLGGLVCVVIGVGLVLWGMVG